MNELIFRCVDPETRRLLVSGPAGTADLDRPRQGGGKATMEYTWSLSLEPGTIQALNRRVLTSLGSLRFEAPHHHQVTGIADAGDHTSHSNTSATTTTTTTLSACVLPCLTVLLPSRIEVLKPVEPLAVEQPGEPAVGKFRKLSDLVYLVLVGRGIDDLLRYCEAHCIPSELRDTEAYVLMLRRRNEPKPKSDTYPEGVEQRGETEELLPMTKKERESLLSELSKLGEESEHLIVTVTEGEYEFQYTFA